MKNALVFDGLSSGKSVDLAVTDGRVVSMSQNLAVDADRVIDARGKWIAPGFVDIHTHYDLEVELAPGLPESVRHGVTSVVMGGCSLSATFGEPSDLAHIFSRVETLPPELIAEWLKSAEPWNSPQAYFKHLNQLALGANVASMLGHSSLRVQVMGLERSLSVHATTDEINQMRALAEAALDAGCIGISIDMVHWHKVSGPFAGQPLPSHNASFEEYKMLADVCRRRDAVFQVTPNPQNPFSLFDIFRLSPGVWRAPLRCTILAALDMDSAPLFWRIYLVLLFICNRLLGCNIRFQTLSEPFTIFADGHLTPFFEEFAAGVKLNNCSNREERLALWKDPDFRKEFVHSWKSGFPRTFHRDLSRMTIVSAPDESLNGSTIAQSAHRAKQDPLQHFMDLLQNYDDQLRWVACNANMRVNVREKLMSMPHVLPGFSDAGAHSRNLAFFDSALSVIRQAATTGFMPIEKAIARVTSEPAAWFNLDAGRITVGGKADFSILDPDRLSSPIPEPVLHSDPTFDNAFRMVKRDPNPAIAHVFIRGKEVVRDGEPLKTLGAEKLGDILLQQNPTASEFEALERFRNRTTDRGIAAYPVLSRKQANATGLVESIERYWPVFLLKHQHPTNVAMHCFGFVLMYLIPALSLFSHNVWIMLFMPLSQLTGLIGHWLFEPSPIDQRDTVFSWRAFVSLHLMFYFVLIGRYQTQLLRVQSRSTLIQQT
ncbi:MAG TPA: amidohydrolase family protein [Drouetiella sp.]